MTPKDVIQLAKDHRTGIRSGVVNQLEIPLAKR